jgi:quercetin dioxygenase-like cupin family protein
VLANRSGDKIVELLRLPPQSRAVEVEAATLEPKYKVTLNGGAVRTVRKGQIVTAP